MIGPSNKTSLPSTDSITVMALAVALELTEKSIDASSKKPHSQEGVAEIFKKNYATVLEAMRESD